MLKQTKLTLKIIRLAVHEDVVDQDDAEDARPKVQVTEQQHESHILSNRGTITETIKLSNSINVRI